MARKLPALQAALRGHVTEHHRFLLLLLMGCLESLEGLIAELGARIETVMPPFAEAVERLKTCLAPPSLAIIVGGSRGNRHRSAGMGGHRHVDRSGLVP